MYGQNREKGAGKAEGVVISMVRDACLKREVQMHLDELKQGQGMDC